MSRPSKEKANWSSPASISCAGLVLVEQGAVGVEAGDDAGVVGVADHLEEVGMEERFAAVQEVDVGDETLGLVDDLLEQLEVHEALLLLGQVLVGAHDAAQVADAGRLDPQADGHVVEAGLAAFVGAEDLAQALVVFESGHEGAIVADSAAPRKGSGLNICI